MLRIKRWKEELNALKEEIKNLNEKLSALTEEELEQVTGGLGCFRPESAKLKDAIVDKVGFSLHLR